MRANAYFPDLSSKEMNVYTFRNLIIELFEKRREKIVYLMAWKRKKKNFKYVKNKINKDNLSLRIRYRFDTKNETTYQQENVFVFDLETCNVVRFAKAYAAGLNDVNRFRDRWDGDLTVDEIVTEKDNVTVFDGSNTNPVMIMLTYVSANYEGDDRTCFDEDGDEIVSSYRSSLVAINASGFDSWVALSFLVKQITEVKVVKTARGLISLSFRCGFKIVNRVEVPRHVKLTC